MSDVYFDKNTKDFIRDCISGISSGFEKNTFKLIQEERKIHDRQLVGQFTLKNTEIECKVSVVADGRFRDARRTFYLDLLINGTKHELWVEEIDIVIARQGASTYQAVAKCLLSKATEVLTKKLEEGLQEMVDNEMRLIDRYTGRNIQ